MGDHLRLPKEVFFLTFSHFSSSSVRQNARTDFKESKSNISGIPQGPVKGSSMSVKGYRMTWEV